MFAAVVIATFLLKLPQSGVLRDGRYAVVIPVISVPGRRVHLDISQLCSFLIVARLQNCHSTEESPPHTPNR
ncbi:MAG TPA: hypothetical protein VD837_06895 [Terriglobales bacterium]|nr:hypothetical protein [Terriglobales bacterium]